jgi:hypothetical protein
MQTLLIENVAPGLAILAKYTREGTAFEVVDSELVYDNPREWWSEVRTALQDALTKDLFGQAIHDAVEAAIAQEMETAAEADYERSTGR